VNSAGCLGRLLDRLRIEAMREKHRQVLTERLLVARVFPLVEGLLLQHAVCSDQLVVAGQQVKMSVGVRDLSGASTHGVRLPLRRPGVCAISNRPVLTDSMAEVAVLEFTLGNRLLEAVALRFRPASYSFVAVRARQAGRDRVRPVGVILMRMTTKGQVTIPIEMREKLGLLPNSEVEFDLVGDSVRIRKARGAKGRGQRLLALMRRAPKPRPGMTTDQLMALTRGDE